MKEKFSNLKKQKSRLCRGNIRIKVMWTKNLGKNFTCGVKFINVDEEKFIKLSACYKDNEKRVKFIVDI